MHHQHGRGMGMMGYNGLNTFWIILSVILLLVILFLIYKLIQNSKQTSVQNDPYTALNILKERYAKGEITDEEFEHKRKNIEG